MHEITPGAGGAASSGKRLRILVGFLLIVAAVIVLVAQANKSNLVYYVTVSELLAQEQPREKGLRVTGTVVPGSIERAEMQLRFRMTDGAKAVPIEYKGVVPDTFGEDGEVVVEGRYVNDTFQASFLMAKCPSKYEAQAGPGVKEHPDEIPRDDGARSL